MDRNEVYYEGLRNRLNVLHYELQEMPKKYKHGYYLNVPSILNAYREGDISFDRACELLEMKSAQQINAGENLAGDNNEVPGSYEIKSNSGTPD